MGITNKQFNDYIRLLLDDLKELETETDEEKRNEKLQKIIKNLRLTLESSR